jgi:hypothetical protein
MRTVLTIFSLLTISFSAVAEQPVPYLPAGTRKFSCVGKPASGSEIFLNGFHIDDLKKSVRLGEIAGHRIDITYGGYYGKQVIAELTVTSPTGTEQVIYGATVGVIGFRTDSISIVCRESILE